MAPDAGGMLSLSPEILPAHSVVPVGSLTVDRHSPAEGSAVDTADRRLRCQAVPGSNAGRNCHLLFRINVTQASALPGRCFRMSSTCCKVGSSPAALRHMFLAAYAGICPAYVEDHCSMSRHLWRHSSLARHLYSDFKYINGR
jgi:hypothetical protein